MFSKDSTWSYVINLSNGIIGVSVLTMPFCLEQCGIILGIILLLATNLLTRLTCQILVKGAYLVRRRSFEQFAFHCYGNFGKTFVEICMILYTKATLVAFFVVIGDLGPVIFTDFFGISIKTDSFRIVFMIFLGVFVILPLSLLKTLDSLSHISSLAVLFYGFLVFRLFVACVPNLFSLALWREVNLWRTEGVMQCLPIFAMSLSCQTQLFVISNEIPDSNPSKMDSIVGGAVNLCASIYLSVGLFGYVAFYDKAISGDILVFLKGNALTQFIKLGFLLSVAVSYPLMIFPCRAAIYSMLFKQESNNSFLADISTASHIPPVPLKVITIFLIMFNLLVAIFVPNMELILGLSGSLIGSVICFIIPAILFLTVAPPNYFHLKIASQVCIIVGVFMLIFCTYATVLHHRYVPPEHQNDINSFTPKIFNDVKPEFVGTLDVNQVEQTQNEVITVKNEEAVRKRDTENTVNSSDSRKILYVNDVKMDTSYSNRNETFKRSVRSGEIDIKNLTNNATNF